MEALPGLFKTAHDFRTVSRIIRLQRNEMVHMDPKTLSLELLAELTAIPEVVKLFNKQKQQDIRIFKTG